MSKGSCDHEKLDRERFSEYFQFVWPKVCKPYLLKRPVYLNQDDLENLRSDVSFTAFNLFRDPTRFRDEGMEVLTLGIERRPGRIPVKFVPWLLAVTDLKLKEYDRKRRARNRRTTTLPTDGFLEDRNGCCQHDQLEKKEKIVRVRDAVLRLPEDLRIVITLRHFQDCTYQQIAEQLKMPETQVQSKLRSGWKRLREILGPFASPLCEESADV